MKILFLISLIFTTIGCAIPKYTKFDKSKLYWVGYSEIKLLNNPPIFRVRYVDTNPMRAYKNWLKRASYITLHHKKYRFFKKRDVNPSKYTRDYSMTYGSQQPHRGLPMYESMIVLFKSKRKCGKNCFDAKKYIKQKRKNI